jgi:CIC family chloride channel protein
MKTLHLAKIQERSARSLEALKQWVEAQTLHQHENKVLLMLTLMIGAVVGLVIVAFIVLTENLGARMYPAEGDAWRRIVVPVLGALVTGYLLKRYFPNARGSGIPQTKTALFIHEGVIRFRTVLGKFCCSSVSLASGIALGREGPSVQVGAGIASTLGRQLGLSAATIKSLVPIGASAALATAFNTPIAAVLFTLEEVMGDLHARVLGAIVLSSATSWMVLHLLLGDEPLFHVPAYQLVNPLEFGIYAVLGMVGGLVSVCFVSFCSGCGSILSACPPGQSGSSPLQAACWSASWAGMFRLSSA